MRPEKGYTGPYTVWSEEMIEDLLSLHSQGYGYRTLAEQFDRTRDAVRSMIREQRGERRAVRARGERRFRDMRAWRLATR